VQTSGWLKRVSEMFEIGDTTAHVRLPLEQTNIDAARSEQGSRCQSSNATANDNHFVIHLISRNTAGRKSEHPWVAKIRQRRSDERRVGKECRARWRLDE